MYEDRISAVASRASWDGVRGAFGDLRSSHSDPGILMALVGVLDMLCVDPPKLVLSALNSSRTSVEQWIVCGGGVVDHAWDGLRHAAAANATVEPFVGALRALAAVAPGDFYGGLRDHALDLLRRRRAQALDGAR